MDYLVAVLLPQLLHGLVFGAALGLLALGLTVIFGLLGVMNFAHGELYMLGAYAGIAVVGVTHSFWVALILAPLLVAALGAVTEIATLRPIYRREPLYGLILTFGLALVFREGARQIWGGDMRRILPPVTGSTPLLGMTYPNYRLFLLGASSVLLLAIWLFFTRTRAGILVRAAVQDAEMLDGLGVNVPRLFTLTFAGSAALPALRVEVLPAPRLRCAPLRRDRDEPRSPHGVYGARLLRPRRLLRARRVRDGHSPGARRPVGLGVPRSGARRGRAVRGGRELLRHRAPGHLLRAAHADLRRGRLHVLPLHADLRWLGRHPRPA